MSESQDAADRILQTESARLEAQSATGLPHTEMANAKSQQLQDMLENVRGDVALLAKSTNETLFPQQKSVSSTTAEAEATQAADPSVPSQLFFAPAKLTPLAQPTSLSPGDNPSPDVLPAPKNTEPSFASDSSGADWAFANAATDQGRGLQSVGERIQAALEQTNTLINSLFSRMLELMEAQNRKLNDTDRKMSDLSNQIKSLKNP